MIFWIYYNNRHGESCFQIRFKTLNENDILYIDKRKTKNRKIENIFRRRRKEIFFFFWKGGEGGGEYFRHIITKKLKKRNKNILNKCVQIYKYYYQKNYSLLEQTTPCSVTQSTLFLTWYTEHSPYAPITVVLLIRPKLATRNIVFIGPDKRILTLLFAPSRQHSCNGLQRKPVTVENIVLNFKSNSL